MDRKTLKNNILLLFAGWIAKSLYDNKIEVIILSFWDKGVTLFKLVGLFVLKALNFELKVWCLILVLFLICIIKILIKMNLDNAKENNQNEPLIFEVQNYTEDAIKDYRYKWNWYWSSYTGRYEVKDLALMCPKCDTYIHSDNYGKYNCPRCDTELYPTPPENSIKKIIQDNYIRKFEGRE